MERVCACIRCRVGRFDQCSRRNNDIGNPVERSFYAGTWPTDPVVEGDAGAAGNNIYNTEYACN